MLLSTSNNIKDAKNSSVHSDINLAVRRALVLSAVAAAGTGVMSAPAYAQEQSATAGGDEVPTQTVTVTGSRIRRVDTETASPVYTIDNSTIQQSGVSTVGELIMQLPSINGAATNPSVNNGGGFGESYIELRGLDAKRTVILIDGRRVGLIGDPGSATSAVDVNQIPLSIIDHVEVLKEGAGAIYGSDAIAGVVNFITRKDVQGLEISADYGRTTADDGSHHQVNVTMGEQTDKFSFMLSGRYQKQDAVSEGDRSFSNFALYNYSHQVSKGGSSRTPTGRITVPTDANGNPIGFPDGSFSNGACSTVTKISGAPGNDDRGLPLLHRPRPLQLRADQPPGDPPGARQPVRESQLQDQRSRRGLHELPVQPHDVGLPGSGVALGCECRQRHHLQEQHVQPVRRRLRRHLGREPERAVPPPGSRPPCQQHDLHERDRELRAEGRSVRHRLAVGCVFEVRPYRPGLAGQRLLLLRQAVAGPRAVDAGRAEFRLA